MNRLTYLGHATTLIELDGVRLLTDPLLRARVAHLRRAGPPAAPGDVDAVLVSHGHYDHLDLPSLDRMPRRTPVVVPHGLGPLLRRRGFDSVTEVAAGDEVPFGELVVRVVHAEHGGRTTPRRRAAAVGYAALGSARVLFAGDTDLFPEMAGLVEDLDLALLPIWGWGPRLGPGHLDPRRAAEAVALLRPRQVVPIHWGTFRPLHRGGRAPFLEQPAAAFTAAAREIAPDVVVHVLRPGEALDL
jgi:L-ascorbate metabolism protein UlaG (beta-lactamase superfamily)